MNSIVEQDLERIFLNLSPDERSRFNGGTVLITGCAGSLGYCFVQFLLRYRDRLGIRRLIGLDICRAGRPAWLRRLEEDRCFQFSQFDIACDDISTVENAGEAEYILHMASIASPSFYRRHPMETIDANVWGLRNLLEYYRERSLKGLAFFSSSEIYGNPDPAHIPTPETYCGSVNCVGPRACYDEAKRFGETLCYLFHQKHNMPVVIIRPFNVYGPGMRLNDARVPADFARAVCEKRDLVLFSDGTPTRTFCYVSDAVTGCLKALLHERFDVFNIGTDGPEVSVLGLAELFKTAGEELFGYAGVILKASSDDLHYLTDNPLRRCPNIEKARTLLGYSPQIDVLHGVRRYLSYLKECPEDERIW